ncbi:hypothetical protein [Indioceanicola profundi]|uniref:hypothetical protein n=1 Tax=Indioceanicola profundi TaxID=2220096 RepID=UPI000E6A98B3|nr:hypothetical protein [Indioceanicola profundi]
MTIARIFIRLLGAAMLLAIAALLYLYLMPLPEDRFSTPVWIGPAQVVDVAAAVDKPDRALRIEDGQIAGTVRWSQP